MKSLVNCLDRLEASDRSPEIADGLGSLVRRQTEIEKAAHGAVFDEDRVREACQRQPRNTAEQAVARDHRGVQAVQLLLREELQIVGFCRTLSGRIAPPRQRIPQRIARREHEHQPPDDACQRTALLARMGTKPAESASTDTAKTR